MTNLYDIMLEMKTLFEAEGYTVKNMFEFDHDHISKLSEDVFPIICLGRKSEEIDDAASPTDFMVMNAVIDVNVVLYAKKEDLELESSIELRKIKNVIYNNRSNQDWCDWIMVDNFIAQLANSNDRSSIYGGININTTVNYREKQKDIAKFMYTFDDQVFTGDKYLLRGQNYIPDNNTYLYVDESLATTMDDIAVR